MYEIQSDPKAIRWMVKFITRGKNKTLATELLHARSFTIRYIAESAELQRRPPRHRHFPRASIRSVMHLGAAMDDDNAMSRHKWIVDWLVQRGVIPDDRRTVLDWGGRLPEQIVKRDGNYSIAITLTPISPNS